jgi:hypothetical protein
MDSRPLANIPIGFLGEIAAAEKKAGIIDPCLSYLSRKI